MQLLFPILASGDSWIGLLIFIIIAVVSSLSKKMQQGQEPEMPEELPPRPFPPRPATPQHHPPVVVQQPQQTRRNLTEEQVQEVLRRMRRPAQSHVPPPAPPIVKTVKPAPRRMVHVKQEESELPFEHPELAPHETELPSVHPEAAPREAMPSSLQPSRAAAAPVAVLSPRASPYREQLRSRMEIRRAIVLRELLGPPLALRQDW